MLWIPDLPRTLNLVWKIQGRENLVADASNLFWEFFNRAYPTAVHIHAIHLVRTHRLHDSLLSEDVREAVRKVTSLRERLPEAGGAPAPPLAPQRRFGVESSSQQVGC